MSKTVNQCCEKKADTGEYLFYEYKVIFPFDI